MINKIYTPLLLVLPTALSIFALTTFYEGDGLPLLAIPSIFAPAYLLLAIFQIATMEKGASFLMGVAGGLSVHAITAAIAAFVLNQLVIMGIVMWLLITIWAAYKVFSRPFPTLITSLVGFAAFLCIAEVLIILFFYASVLQSML